MVGMLLNAGRSNGRGGRRTSIQSPPQVLSSVPLLVYEYEDPAGSTPTAAAKMLMYSLPERSIVYTHDSRPQAMEGNFFSTPQGWLVILGQVTSEASMWHPLTGETITLPPIHDDHYIPHQLQVPAHPQLRRPPGLRRGAPRRRRSSHVVLPCQWRG